MIRTLWQDLRYGGRKLRRSPGFTAVAVLTLALGIGANSAIFSVVNAVLLQPLPYAEPQRLVLVWDRMTQSTIDHAPLSSPDLADLRHLARGFAGFAATNNVSEAVLNCEGEPQQLLLAGVTDDFFAVLGVEPMLGRDFVPADAMPFPPEVFEDPDTPPPPTALILSNGLWRRSFGGDPGILGETVWVNSQPMTVIGVMPQGFELLMPPDAGMPTDIDAWSPLRLDLAAGARDNQWLRVIARLAPGVTLAEAQAELDAIATRHREEHAFHRKMGIHLDARPMHGDVVGHVRPALLALLGAVGFVLLIACANVANLLLARATLRRQEMAVRAALGAGRWRLFRQMLTEGLLLAALGAGGGLLLARLGVRLLLTLRPPDLPRVDAVGVDGRVLVFTLAVAVGAALLFGLAPALRTSLAGARGVLGERGAAGGRAPLRSVLVVSEVALSLVLLIGAGLMVRSFVELSRVRPGFDPDGVLTYRLQLPFPSYRTPQARTAFYLRMQEEVAALPGVEAVGAVFPLPLAGRFWTGPYGRPDEPQESWIEREASFRVVTAGYFEAMGIQRLAGRGLSAADIEEQRPVTVIDTALAERLWPERSPLGERLGIDLFGNIHKLEVVGVVERVRHDDLAKLDRETVYLPQHLFPWSHMTVAVRAGELAPGLGDGVRRVVEGLDPELPVYRVRTLDSYVTAARAASRFTLVLSSVFAAVAALLAAVGLGGLVAYTVRQRRHEIGIRMALGAPPLRILAEVLGRGVLLSLAGIGLGLLASLALTRGLSGLLYGVSPRDPITFVALAAMLTLVALAAAWLPAQRAANVDPMEALRSE